MPSQKFEYYEQVLDSSDEDSDEEEDDDSDASSDDGSDDASDEGSDDEDSDDDSDEEDDSDDEASDDGEDGSDEEEPSEDDVLKQFSVPDEDYNRIYRILKAHSVRVAFKPPFTVFRFLETRAETRALAFQILMEEDVVPQKDLLDYHDVDGGSGEQHDIESLANDWRHNISEESMRQLEKNTQQNRYNVNALPQPPPLVTSYQNGSKQNLENDVLDPSFNRYDAPRAQDESILRRHNEENVPPPLETNEQVLKQLTKLETFTYRTPGLPLSEQYVPLRAPVALNGASAQQQRSFPFHRQSNDTPIPQQTVNFTATPFDRSAPLNTGTSRLTQYQRVMDNFGNIL